MDLAPTPLKPITQKIFENSRAFANDNGERWPLYFLNKNQVQFTTNFLTNLGFHVNYRFYLVFGVVQI